MNNKWDGWYESLPKHTQEYLIDRAIWTDRDLFVFTLIAVIVGYTLGYVLK
jgi:hypothetical protein